MRILVVGGAGYIGSHAVRCFEEHGHAVIVYDNLSLGHREAVRPEQLIVGDLRDTSRLTDTLRTHQPDAVVHFAAFTAVGESVRDPARYYANNVAGSLALLDAMRAAHVSRIVFSSTAATYGTPRTVPIPETEPTHPESPYGRSKLMVEQILQDHAHAYGLRPAILRYFNAAGADPSGTLGEDHTPETHLIPLVLQVALGQREAIEIFGDDYPTPDGTCLRDYIHVGDLATAHLRALEALDRHPTLLCNLGTGSGHSVAEVVAAAEEVTGQRIRTRLASRRPGDVAELVAAADRARTLLGWAPEYTSLTSIIETAWNWHRRHPRGYATNPPRLLETHTA